MSRESDPRLMERQAIDTGDGWRWLWQAPVGMWAGWRPGHPDMMQMSVSEFVTNYGRRTWTHTQFYDGGRKITVKMACNGCGILLGDATEDECLAPSEGRPLGDRTGECFVCSGAAALP